jgi:hypothetical protein
MFHVKPTITATSLFKLWLENPIEELAILYNLKPRLLQFEFKNEKYKILSLCDNACYIQQGLSTNYVLPEWFQVNKTSIRFLN